MRRIFDMQISWLQHGVRKSGKSMYLVKYRGSIMKMTD